MYSKDANRFIKVVEELSRRVQVVHPAGDVSPEDREFFLTLLGLRTALLEDLLPGSILPDLWRRTLMSLKEINVYSYYKDLKSLKVLFLDIMDQGAGCVSPRDFNRRGGQVVQNHWLLTVLKQFPSVIDPYTASVWYQWLAFDEKANFRSIDYSDALKGDYLRLEAEQDSWEYPDLSEYAEIMEEWLRDYAPCEDFCPRHGPGSIAECTGRPSPAEKSLLFRTDTELDQFIREVLFAEPDQVLYKPERMFTHQWRTNEFVSVPKSALTNRGIGKEPCSLQWIQQGLSFHLMEVVERNPRIPIVFSSQDASRRLARLGSLDGSYGTVDLSAASDSVTLSHFCGIFCRTDLMIAGLATRSEYGHLVLSDGTESKIRLNKFAPMGSSLCFPVESLVFAVVCERVARQSYGRKRSYRYYQVFGDDIVVHHSLYSKVVRDLEALNFRVNGDKSYDGQGPLRFREACGCEAVNGVDITPFRISRGIYLSALGNQDESPGQYGALIDHCNNAGRSRLYCVQACLHKLASRSSLYPQIQRVGYEQEARYAGVSPHFLTFDLNATNYLVRHRTNSVLKLKEGPTRTSFFTTEYRVRAPKAMPRESESQDLQDAAYWLYFWKAWRDSRTSRAQDESVRGASYFGSSPARWSWKWVISES